MVTTAHSMSLDGFIADAQLPRRSTSDVAPGWRHPKPLESCLQDVTRERHLLRRGSWPMRGRYLWEAHLRRVQCLGWKWPDGSAAPLRRDTFTTRQCPGRSTALYLRHRRNRECRRAGSRGRGRAGRGADGGEHGVAMSPSWPSRRDHHQLGSRPTG